MTGAVVGRARLRYLGHGKMDRRLRSGLAAAASLAVLAACGTVELQGIGREEAGGGAPGTGGGPTGGSEPACAVPLAERVQVRAVDVGSAVVASDEYHPTVVAPAADGGSLLAWRAAGLEEIHVTWLDGDDAPVATSPAVPGLEVHAALAHDDGGGAIVVLADDPDIYSAQHCTADLTQYCARLDLVRFDAAGAVTWQTKLTGDENVAADGALFVYWYQHTARLVFASDTYGVYFRSARSVADANEPTGVALHAGDTFRFVDAGGALLQGGWDWGCSHSWSVRLAYDGVWAAACHGDPYPPGMRVTILEPGGTRGQVTFSEGVDPSERALGGLVPRDGSFFLSHVMLDEDGERAAHLAKVDDDGTLTSDVEIALADPIDGVYPFRAYMAAYGEDRFLLGYKSGGELMIAVIDEQGGVVEGPVAIDAPIDNFSEFVATPDGDVIWAHSDGGVTVTRVDGC